MNAKNWLVKTSLGNMAYAKVPMSALSVNDMVLYNYGVYKVTFKETVNRINHFEMKLIGYDSLERGDFNPTPYESMAGSDGTTVTAVF